jgi:hypothetical protein
MKTQLKKERMHSISVFWWDGGPALQCRKYCNGILALEIVRREGGMEIHATAIRKGDLI